VILWAKEKQKEVLGQKELVLIDKQKNTLEEDKYKTDTKIRIRFKFLKSNALIGNALKLLLVAIREAMVSLSRTLV
jgi:hypothetical protein